jgi:hypothetical protein
MLSSHPSESSAPHSLDHRVRLIADDRRSENR